MKKHSRFNNRLLFLAVMTLAALGPSLSKAHYYFSSSPVESLTLHDDPSSHSVSEPGIRTSRHLSNFYYRHSSKKRFEDSQFHKQVFPPITVNTQPKSINRIYSFFPLIPKHFLVLRI